jgi:ketosteroid isomerase-like protein
MQDVTEVWEAVTLFPEEFRDLGERVLALGRVRARGGGIRIDNPTGWVWQMRDGRIASCRVYGSHEEALAAVGLSE